MQLQDFHYELPAKLIARHPLPLRSSSRLLSLHPTENTVTHHHFSDFLHFLSPGDLLILNNTRVIPARLLGHKSTGGQVEILIERMLDAKQVLVQMRVSKQPRPGDILSFGKYFLTVVERRGVFYVLSCDEASSISEIIESLGQIPLPHYMRRLPAKSDIERYQTIFASENGSVAAPTAGLHFDEEIFAALKQKNIAVNYLTLHIGAGTFAPIRAEKWQEHKMHAEYIEVSQALCAQIEQTKANGNRVIAVGTTTLRALESASKDGKIAPFAGDTDIFIYPGYQFQVVDALITNLHLPCSSLLMLVCAFGGHAKVMQAYQEAVANRYRFYSYGDAMWIPKA